MGFAPCALAASDVLDELVAPTGTGAGSAGGAAGSPFAAEAVEPAACSAVVESAAAAAAGQLDSLVFVGSVAVESGLDGSADSAGSSGGIVACSSVVPSELHQYRNVSSVEPRFVGSAAHPRSARHRWQLSGAASGPTG